MRHSRPAALVTSRARKDGVALDRCALFVDAGYALADGALAVHGTRNRDSVSWDFEGLLKLLGGLSTDRTGVPLLRCYWYDSVAGGDRTAEHDKLADLPGIKLRLSKVRPSRKEGVEAEIRRDLSALARNRAVSDVVIVSGEEDLSGVIAEVQDLGIRAVLLHVTVDGNVTVSRSLRQECDDTIDVSALQLRPFVDLIAGAEPSAGDGQPAARAYGDSAAAFQQATAAGRPDATGGYRELTGVGSREPAANREQTAAAYRDPATDYRDPAVPGSRNPAAAAFGEVPPGFRETATAGFRDPADATFRPGYADPAAPGSGQQSAAPVAQPYAPQGAPDYRQSGQPQRTGPGPVRDERDPLTAQDPARFARAADPARAQSGAAPGPGQNGYAPADFSQSSFGQNGFGQNGFGQSGFTAPQDVNGHRGSPEHASRQGAADGGIGQGSFPGSVPDGATGRNGVHAAPVHNDLQMFPGHGADGGVAQNGSAAAPGLISDAGSQGSPSAGGVGRNPLGPDPLGHDPLGQNPLTRQITPSQQPGLPMGQEADSRSMHAPAQHGSAALPIDTQLNGGPRTGLPQGGLSQGGLPQRGLPQGSLPQRGLPPGGLAPAEAQRPLPAQRQLPPGQLPPGNGMPYPPDGGAQYGGAQYGGAQYGGAQYGGGPQPGAYGVPPGTPDYQLGAYAGSGAPPMAAPPALPVPAVTFSVAEAVQSAHAEGYGFGEAVARDAPALWLEAVLARKPRMPSDLEARLLQGSALPIDSLLHDEVRHALRRGFWDALERSRR
jgi:uncharacterized LabA/DUF88 family protein